MPPQRFESVNQAGGRACVTQHKTQHLRQRPIDPLEITLEAQVIGLVELANARGVAAATQVFEKQGVVKLSQLGFTQLKALADVHANPAAAHAVPLRLPLGDVQRVA